MDATYPMKLVINGRDLGTFDSEKDMKRAIVRYQIAAVSEGHCPVHEGRLSADGRCPDRHHAWRIAPDGTEDWVISEVGGHDREDLTRNMAEFWGN